MFKQFMQYVGVQGVLALALTAGVLTLALSGRAVPDVLANLTTAAIGFYFGSKGGQVANAIVRRALGAEEAWLYVGPEHRWSIKHRRWAVDGLAMNELDVCGLRLFWNERQGTK